MKHFILERKRPENKRGILFTFTEARSGARQVADLRGSANL